MISVYLIFGALLIYRSLLGLSEGKNFWECFAFLIIGMALVIYWLLDLVWDGVKDEDRG